MEPEKPKKKPPYELGLTLTGEDARRFHEYMADPNPHSTPEGREVMREAIWILRKKEMEKWHESGGVSALVCPDCGGPGCWRMKRGEYNGEPVVTCQNCKLKWKIETKLMTRKVIIKK